MDQDTDHLECLPADGGSNNKLQFAVSLQRSRDDANWHMGHMWVFWREPESSGAEYRGYYPKLNCVPPGHRHTEGLRTYLIENEVPGQYIRDDDAAALQEADTPLPILTKRWPCAAHEFNRLLATCYLPVGCDEQEEGHYSCSEQLLHTHNCSSWSIARINDAAKAALVSCDRPKRLKYVEAAIWGDELGGGSHIV